MPRTGKTIPAGELTAKVAVVVGTRPGIIKMSPVIGELKRRGTEFILIHTGQHYSNNMDRVFFRELDLPESDYHLRRPRRGSLHGEQTAHMLKGMELILLEAKPRLVLVCGDANTNLAAALAARKLHVAVGHVEAGFRSFDWAMPEEHNRVMIDHISDLLFAPTEECRAHLLAERVRGEIFVTGNTVVDAAIRNSTLAAEQSRILKRLGIEKRPYMVATIHREENVDGRERLGQIVSILNAVTREVGMPLFMPLHPRTRSRLETYQLYEKLEDSEQIIPLKPLGYLDFLLLLGRTRLVLTDSGGIQQESCTLRVPCVTLRENTESTEALRVGANLVAGLEERHVVAAVRTMLERPREWANPYGDGLASRRIVDVVAGWEPGKGAS